MAEELESAGAEQSDVEEAEDSSVSLFREYLRIKTVQPTPDYDGAVEFLRKVAEDIGLSFRHLELVSGKPIVFLTWTGQDPKLPSILLNSHIDVVPVFPEHWKHPPFSAFKDNNGDIYARGAQDMKCVGIQYIEAVRRLKQEGRKMLRTIHLSFMPDEEIGGNAGMLAFVNSPEFSKLNIGFALDEGLASPTDVIPVYYGERSCWWVDFRIEGNPGHGSQFIENTSSEKLRRLMSKILDFREAEWKRLQNDGNLSLGDVTTANITRLQGGVQHNVVPAEITMGVDFRISPHQSLEAFEKLIQQWIANAGENVTYSFPNRTDSLSLTSTSSDDPWWSTFVTACKELKLKIKPAIFPAGTDSRFLRKITGNGGGGGGSAVVYESLGVGVPALGFSPMRNTPVLLHDHNEFLNENTFLEGLQFYCHIIPAIANVARV